MSKTKRLLSMLLVVALVAGIAISGTLAYLTSEDGDVNVMTLGNVKIEQLEYQRVQNDDGTYPMEVIDGSNSYKLEEFEQDKPLYPAVYPTNSENWDWEEDKWVQFAQVGANGGGMSVFTEPNAVDKFVFVKNTGKSDAYVRTLIAFECGSKTADEWSKLVGMSNHFSWDDKETIGVITVDGSNYVVVEYVYKGRADKGYHANGVLPAGEVTQCSLGQVYMKSVATNEDVEALDGNDNGTYDILVLSQAVQTAGFSDAATALNTGFGEVNAENAAEWFKNVIQENENTVPVFEGHEVANDDELAEAVANGQTNILLKAGTYNIKSNQMQNKTLTISSNEGAVIAPLNEGEDGCDYGFDGSTVTFNGITIDTSSNTGNYKGFARMEATFNYCKINGAYTTHMVQSFNDCTFNTNNGYIWIWGATEVNFTRCEFAGNSKTILAHGGESSTINITDCDFVATEKGYTGTGDHTAAVEIDPTVTNTYTINFKGENTINENYSGWTRVKDDSTGHTITGLN